MARLIHEDAHLSRYRNGICLMPSYQPQLLPLNEALKFPCNVYLLNTQSEILSINEHSAYTSGFESVSDALGKTIREVLPKNNANTIIEIDQNVIKSQRNHFSEDLMMSKEGTPQQFLTLKAPLFNQSGDIMGILGCSVLLNQHPMAEALTLMAETGLFQGFNYQSGVSKNYIYYPGVEFTPKESEIIYHLVRGKSAKKIAEIVFLSMRTIEDYITVIKAKLGVYSKAELIDKIMDSIL